MRGGRPRAYAKRQPKREPRVNHYKQFFKVTGNAALYVKSHPWRIEAYRSEQWTWHMDGLSEWQVRQKDASFFKQWCFKIEEGMRQTKAMSDRAIVPIRLHNVITGEIIMGDIL